MLQGLPTPNSSAVMADSGPAPTRVVWVSQPAGTTAPVIAAAPAAPRTDEPSDDGGHEGGGDE